MNDLWHVSEARDIGCFTPRASAAHDSPDPLVWAIDDEHVPAYWFPRDCPRSTFWAVDSTSDDDVERFVCGDRARPSPGAEPRIAPPRSRPVPFHVTSAARLRGAS